MFLSLFIMCNLYSFVFVNLILHLSSASGRNASKNYLIINMMLGAIFKKNINEILFSKKSLTFYSLLIGDFCEGL